MIYKPESKKKTTVLDSFLDIFCVCIVCPFNNDDDDDDSYIDGVIKSTHQISSYSYVYITLSFEI